LLEKGGYFAGGKTQVSLAQFGQLSAGAQARQGQGWIGAAGQTQVQLWRQMIEQTRTSVSL